MPHDFLEAVTGTGIEIESVKFFQVLDAFQRFGTEGCLAVERVENDAFEQVAEGHIVIFGQSLEHFEKPFLHADAGLNPLDQQLRFFDHGTNVPWYNESVKATGQAFAMRK